MYAKDLSEPKYEFLIQKREDAGIKHLNASKAFIECSNTMDDIYENIDDYKPTTRRKILIVFDHMIADIMSNKNFQPVVKKLKELQNIAITHSADINYKDFMKIYRECIKEPYIFFGY